MDIGKRIRELREQRGIQQLELANKINISQSKMNKIETGFQKKIEPEIIVEIAKVLGVSTDYLFGHTDLPYPEPLLPVTGPKSRTPYKKIGLLIKELKTNHRLKDDLLMELLKINQQELNKLYEGEIPPTERQAEILSALFEVRKEFFLPKNEVTEQTVVKVAGKEINLTPEELKVFEELKKNPAFFHDLASDPERKIKELIKLQKAKKLLLEEDDENYGNGFGDLDDDL